MATIIKCEALSNPSDIVVQRGVDISGGLPTMDTEVMVVIDRDDLLSGDEYVLLGNIKAKITYPQS